MVELWIGLVSPDHSHTIHVIYRFRFKTNNRYERVLTGFLTDENLSNMKSTTAVARLTQSYLGIIL